MKNKRYILPIILIILVLALGTILVLTNKNNNLSGEVISGTDSDNPSNLEGSLGTAGIITSNELHWAHMPLTYHFNTLPSDACEDCVLVCASSQKDKVKQAFEQIKKDTDNVVSFEENENSGDLEIYCYGDKYSGEGDLITLGEGGYENQGNEILSGTLNFYGQNSGGKDSNCLELILHEIFHTFGFNHTEEGLMKPVGVSKLSGNYRCQYDIDDYIIEDLKRIYG